MQSQISTTQPVQNDEPLKVSGEIPYAGNINTYSHPDRLAVIGRLFDMNPASVARSSVLEIGCGEGSNLIPIAFAHPQSRCVGLGLFSEEVECGKSLIERLGLKNIEVIAASELDLEVNCGEFDYIIVNGMYSWVPVVLQQKILRICRQHLAPQGIAYINYNTNPGWRFHGLMRDMLQYHTKSLADPMERLRQSAGFISALSHCFDSLGNNSPGTPLAYGIDAFDSILKEELNSLTSTQSLHGLQDYLATYNQPLYFHQFVEQADAVGLQYVGEAEFGTMRLGNFPETVQQALLPLADDMLKLEQYMDFVRNRSFRQTLLCRKNVQLNRSVSPERIMTCFIASLLVPENESVEVNSQESQAFKFGSEGQRAYVTCEPITKAALRCLADSWPASLSFEQLLQRAAASLDPSSEVGRRNLELNERQLASDLLEAYAQNLVQFRTEQDCFVSNVSTHPKASDLARAQAERGQLISSQLHESISVDLFTRHMLVGLDGSRDKEALLRNMAEQIESGALVVQKDGEQLVASQESTKRFLVESIDECLSKLSKLAILVA